ncbi:hypothetical protein SETIT_4G128700v2 [Setaria italica]|uniref:PGG domain-containing protein n=2 Tax=Setaria italica TaxID=4555 RepID=A0A368QU13_SETIT|nr:uncharacterized protein LOC101785371 [Setaria italica]RCV21303.1 hypothetical protein SETIT_4G128700v2 [Setaria italica]RCV21304.1 hypothetical protein SETIT_4G128700v2 [Setaria italica]
MAKGEQPKLAIALTSTAVTPEAGNNHSEDSNTHGGSTEELGTVTGNTRQESRVTADFELLWRLRKYLLLLGTLAVSVTYNAGLTPPGGFWLNNTKKGRDGHHAGDSVLRALFFQRHEVFFYCNATAFAASLVLIIFLLSKNVTRQKLWLRSMQLTMILDLFSLMGAYAAGSCRAVKSSIYIWVLVFAVFVYIMIHILVFILVVPKFFSEKRFVPKWLKEKVHSVQGWILSKCHKSQRNSPQEKDIDEARKFIFMLVTFAATVTYQAGLSPPGGFWAENEQNKIPATSMLRSKNLARYNTFVTFNSTSFVASLVTIILLLSPELSGHGIRSKAVTVCVVVDILGLIGAYAAGSCRSMVTSFGAILLAVVVWIFFAVLAGTFVNRSVAAWFEKIRPDFMKCINKLGRVISLNFGSSRSINTVGENSVASHRQTAGCETEPESASVPECQLAYNQQVSNTKEGESSREHQSPGKQQTANNEEVGSSSEDAFVNDKQAANSNNVMCNLEGQSSDHNSIANEAMPEIKTENIQVASMEEKSSLVDDLMTPNTIAGMSNHEHQLDDNQTVENMIGQSLSTDDHESIFMPVECLPEDKLLANNHNGATNNLKEEKESLEKPMVSIEIEEVENKNATRPIENGNTGMHEVAPRQYASNGNAGANPTDEHLKKSRTYLLLLAILAVSLTYQSGLNPPGGFWSQRENNNSTRDPIPKNNHHRPYHLPGDPVLEDTHHPRYITFFYLNAIAFVASLVMIIMLLNRRMSNKVIKRYALQITMIVDLLALTGSYAMGSCRETKNSIYIWLLVCLVLAYVAVHVLISIHMVPEGCRKAVANKLENFSCRYIWTKASFGHNQRSDVNDNDCELGHNQEGDADDRNWERRRNLLLMLAVLAATVTYQAGMNPPGGVWSDDKAVSGKPGDPILQQNNLKRYDVFYYSNSLSFVSSVVITILLVNKESCEHGIKSYALRVCLVVGLVSLLIAYSAGSCRKARESIYLIIIAVAVLIALVAQVLLLSSAQDGLRGPTGESIERVLQLLFGKESSWHGTTSKQQESSGHPEKNVRKRHKYLMLLAILAASITYQAGLNPPGGFWSDDDEGHVEGNPGLKPPGVLWSDNKGHLAGNPVLLDINPQRYEIFFCFNSISFMASIVVIMFLLNKSARKKSVPLEVLHLIMILDLLALMTAFAAGSCRKFRTSVYVYALVVGVVVYLVIVILLSTGIAKCLRPPERSRFPSQRSPIRDSATSTLIPEDQD